MLTGGGLDALGITSAPPRMPGRARWLAWCWGSFAVVAAVSNKLGPAATSAARTD